MASKISFDRFMVRKFALGALLAAGVLGAGGATAQADIVYKFYRGNDSYVGPYDDAGTVYDTIENFVPATEQVTDCPTPGPANCLVTGDDVVSNSLSFNAGNLIASEDAGSNKVWDDLVPNYGGLGISQNVAYNAGGGTYATSGSGDDQINGSEILTLTFNQDTQLKGIATLFNSGHTPFGVGDGSVAAVEAVKTSIAFLMSVDTVAGGAFVKYLFNDVNNFTNLGMVGQVFKFTMCTLVLCGEDNPGAEFYISGLIVAQGQDIPRVPVPAALPLFFGGLGVLTLMRRRKQAVAQAA